mgnify:CR=1 FL=1
MTEACFTTLEQLRDELQLTEEDYDNLKELDTYKELLDRLKRLEEKVERGFLISDWLGPSPKAKGCRLCQPHQFRKEYNHTNNTTKFIRLTAAYPKLVNNELLCFTCSKQIKEQQQ